MARQVLTVIVGVAVGFMLAAAGGYLLYNLSGRWPHAGPALARYVLNPIIALLVGACVGGLAKSRPGLLAMLSLVPSEFGILINRHLGLTNLLLMVFLGAVGLLIGAGAAIATFRVRARTVST